MCPWGSWLGPGRRLEREVKVLGGTAKHRPQGRRQLVAAGPWRQAVATPILQPIRGSLAFPSAPSAALRATLFLLLKPAQGARRGAENAEKKTMGGSPRFSAAFASPRLFSDSFIRFGTSFLVILILILILALLFGCGASRAVFFCGNLIPECGICGREFNPNPEVACGAADASCCSADIPVCGFTGLSSPVFPYSRAGTGDWKVARTRRLESLRYGRSVIRLRISGSSVAMRCERAGYPFPWVETHGCQHGVAPRPA